ncbi:ABC transporter permease (plasmid) [Rhizobium leguminosarum]|jgi:peptide/nickel transport system permease protein|uniref:ABC transporter permease n=2 Tax=Rhizobium leguminosarum TaxID=384 RepID=A0A1B8RID9_RHILT|nr:MULTISPECIES: ABC transporter permease [Rhizobium]AOO88478.1 ABC transporter permease [Rhizobium leguminosarum bv. trifolii]ASS58691.1 ABC transporter permease [Rhizobium leguminosarum bv. viciae]AXA42463.1 Binding-protein-dependent transport system inner membrane component family protein [Rhizobium leguminosarum]MBA8830432.1 peptide/nickel transport system permease protein [Rhizobium leguminosarum]MBA9033691.1 peptide/nickel transport system permease protein [Rhizobium leguminosarum]
MKSFIGKRAIASGVSLVVLIVIVFFLSRLTGDPTDLYLPIDATTEMRQQFREMNGFNDPLIMQFGRYVSDLAQGNFGQSLRQARPAMDVVLEAFVWTFWLAVITMVLVTIAAIVIGSLAAFRVGGIFDRLATFFSLIGAAAPDFWLAIVAIVIFAVKLHVLPTSGTGTIWHWILPVSVLFIRPFGLILQVVRGSMISVLSSAYVKTARAKGVRSNSIIFIHGLRNAMLPVITVIGDQAAAILNGAVVVETVFGFPGIGKLMIDSILLRDFAVVLAVIMVSALAIFIMNLLIDIAYALLDPRIRY